MGDDEVDVVVNVNIVVDVVAILFAARGG